MAVSSTFGEPLVVVDKGRSSARKAVQNGKILGQSATSSADRRPACGGFALIRGWFLMNTSYDARTVPLPTGDGKPVLSKPVLRGVRQPMRYFAIALTGLVNQHKAAWDAYRPLFLFTILSALCFPAPGGHATEPGISMPTVQQRIVATDSVAGKHYLENVQPLLEKRCVVCHGCYDSPCQFNQGAPEGLNRGANVQKGLQCRATVCHRTEPSAGRRAQYGRMARQRLFPDAERVRADARGQPAEQRDAPHAGAEARASTTEGPVAGSQLRPGAESQTRVPETGRDRGVQEKAPAMGHALWLARSQRHRAQHARRLAQEGVTDGPPGTPRKG